MIPNPEKPTALKERIWGAAQMPDEIELYWADGQDLVFPRGFLHAFTQGMSAYGYQIEWDDQRRYYEIFPLNLTPIKLRDYQEPAVQALVTCEQGIYEAPTAAGKTSCALEALRRVDQPTLIIVDKASLAQQWREEIKAKLGYDAGYFGESEMDFQPITVALRQSIWAHLVQLEKTFPRLHYITHRNFFDVFGCVIFDEVHWLASSGTLQRIANRFTARYRWGISATPDRDPLCWPIAKAVIGPIVHETTEEEAGESLVTPSVRVLESTFEFDYVPTHEEQRLDANGDPVISPRTGRPMVDIVRNNYGAMMSALCSDDDRNLLIADEIVREAEAGHHIVVISRRKGQLRTLAKLLDGHPFPVQMLLGGEKGSRKTEVQQVIEEAATGTVLLSTVASEGLDIPCLDRVVLAYPSRNVETTKQPIGRIRRPAPGKTDAVVIDIDDRQAGLLHSQYLGRRRQLYTPMGWRVDVVGLAEKA
jgi:superfamily II DNA or RNA helicase